MDWSMRSLHGLEHHADIYLSDLFVDRPGDFSKLFRRVLSMNLDSTVPPSSASVLLAFVIGAFQTLENVMIRKECAPLVSISIWHHLHDENARDKLLKESATLRQAWRAAQKRHEVADEATQVRMLFERSWLYSMLVGFLRKLNNQESTNADDVAYCERFLEFLGDLASQLPTRRYANTLFKDLNLIPIIKLSSMFNNEKNVLLRDLSTLLRHFIDFRVDDYTCQQFSTQANHNIHYQALANLQRAAMKHFEDKLKVLALSNFASIDQRSELQLHISGLSADELEQLCTLVGFRTAYPSQAAIVADRQLYIETLLSAFERQPDFQETIAQTSALPTEESLYEPAILRTETYDGSAPLAIPKLNLQYLSLGDFLWRSFVLHRSEAFFEIRKDIEKVVKRMKPRLGKEQNLTLFDGFSKMALPITRPAIIEVVHPKVGSKTPAFVRSEIILDVSRLNEGIRTEWDSLRPGDVVFLVAVRASNANMSLPTNGHSAREAQDSWDLAHIRAAEIIQVLDDQGRPLRDAPIGGVNGFGPRARQRRLLANIDERAYKVDSERVAKGRSDIYASINAIVRRKGRENNFKPVLESIQSLTKADAALPPWFQDVFLGYGDPHAASFMQLPNKFVSVDYRDTFLSWQHLKDSFPGRTIERQDGQEGALEPPYVLRLLDEAHVAPSENSRKRRRDQLENSESIALPIKVFTYKPPNTGPYPIDAPKTNTIRFTPAQADAITSGSQPGLSVIVGPPGTGKTDVATQIINMLYHNHPKERILLVAHSNQALNQLFQKIITLDIDSRHLLRLGHGEEDLETEASYSKYGRVESFLENRQIFLSEVDRLAASIGAEGAHGSSCETADYFNKVFIQPAWSRYWDYVTLHENSLEEIIQLFPFHAYFSNVPHQPLFPPDATPDTLKTIAAGCQSHTDRIFAELASIRPFEILRQSREKQNHLLVSEARIVAMTSTHAAIRRAEIAESGFHYDTLIMEEAAQITEIESFICCAMQKPKLKTGEFPLKRVVLVGDHLQNSPVIQNMALRQYANFEQSLFLRLVKLGVPTINLDQQGRCRPSIADLFKWRYAALGNLPHLGRSAEYIRANAGFRYDYQFIDVPDYQGQGEREPSPHFIQNLGEAEYAVALYQYMRLLGYPARSISILATYAGQKSLIRDVLEHRCQGNRLFGLPRLVTTVDKYQGEQNDYVILSMTRTRSVGYLRDVRRWTVALSRARLGLYIFGSRDLFETCLEMKPALELLNKRTDKLVVTTGEMYPTDRKLDDEVQGTEMDGVEHLGQYVFEMTQAKIKALGGQVAVVEGGATNGSGNGYAGDAVEDEMDEEDPLHESVVP